MPKRSAEGAAGDTPAAKRVASNGNADDEDKKNDEVNTAEEEGKASGGRAALPSNVGEDTHAQAPEAGAGTVKTEGDGGGAEGEGVLVQRHNSLNVRGAYAQREEFLLGLERRGEVVFQGIRNDGSLEKLKLLLAAKNIYSKQLPNMPREYIVKLVFDPTHRTIVVRKPRRPTTTTATTATAAPGTADVKQEEGKGNEATPTTVSELDSDELNCPNSNVVGGITYRSFAKQGRRFGEIAFCAVLAAQQVKGYGTRLMNHAKEYAKGEDGGGLTHFLTYADNAAVGYFAKQGFTKEITLDKEVWQGYIKDYDGGTLMECVLRHEVSYTEFPVVIRQQREALDKVVRTLSNAHVVRPGIYADDGRRIYSSDDPMAIPGLEKTGYKREVPPYSLVIAGGGSGGGSSSAARRYGIAMGEAPTPHNLRRFMMHVLEVVKRHECAWPFLDKVPIAEVPDYYDVVKDPIDIGMIERKVVEGGYYITLEIFAADFKRLFNNCRTYNAPETLYYKHANKLEEVFEACIRAGIVHTKPHHIQ